jgi:hypothetical protein
MATQNDPWQHKMMYDATQNDAWQHKMKKKRTLELIIDRESSLCSK